MTREQTISNLKKLKSFHNGSYGADIDRAIEALEQETCDDAVSRADAIKKVSEILKCVFVEHEDVAQKAMGSLPSVQPKPKTGHWIPVTERLPKDRNPVLVTAYWHETYQVMEASYFGDNLWWCVPFNNTGEHEQKLNPKAWMPLPKPYEAESEETDVDSN